MARKQRDPNKYSKNANIIAESRLSIVLAAVRMGLMIIGIIGLTYEIFRENGLLSRALGDIFDSTANMLFAAIVVLILWLLNRLFSKPHKAEKAGAGDIPMYLMMAIGCYYLYLLFSTGKF